MPVLIGNYEYTYADPTLLTTPQLVAKPRPTYPIEGNSAIYTEDEDYMVLIDYYKPLQPNARHATRSNLFYIRDTPITDIGNGVGKFTRTWSVLPGAGDKNYSRTEYESYAFTVPAFDTTQPAFYQFPVASNSTTNGVTTLTVTLGVDPPFTALDIEVGKPATIIYIVTDPFNGQQLNREASVSPISVAGAVVTFNQIVDIGAITYVGVKRTDVDQPSYTKQVMSKMIYDYWIEGINCTSIEAIPIIQEVQIITSLGARTTTISETTTPSMDDWLTNVNTNKWFVVEPSVIRRWSGGIFERSTRYIRYTL